MWKVYGDTSDPFLLSPSLDTFSFKASIKFGSWQLHLQHELSNSTSLFFEMNSFLLFLVVAVMRHRVHISIYYLIQCN